MLLYAAVRDRIVAPALDTPDSATGPGSSVAALPSGSRSATLSEESSADADLAQRGLPGDPDE